MSWRNTTIAYGSLAKFLHWLIFFLIIVMLTVGFLMDDIKNDSLRGQVFNLHKLTGITILCLMLFRLVWALINPKPMLPSGTPRWQKMAEHIIHGLIYVALIAMPLSGWIMSAAAGHFPHLFGYSLTLPVSKDKALSDLMATTHEYLAYFIIFLISLHVLAALYHHFIKKDEILVRMLPGKNWKQL
jgi:cytochrome b561